MYGLNHCYSNYMFLSRLTGNPEIIRMLFAFCIFFLISQSHGQELMKYGNASDPDLPEWVQAMYKDNADPGEVIQKYNAYYLQHPFIKNGHTQFFKRWIRKFSREHTRTKAEDRVYQQLMENNAARNNNPSDWQSLGPFDWDHSAAGRSYAPGSAHVYTVEQSLANPDIVYAGTATAGLWKSTDRGITWIALTPHLLVNTVYAIESDFSNPDIIYASMLNSIYKSVNGGISFQPTGTTAFQALSLVVKDIRMHPSNNQIIFTCTNQGLYRTTNGAQTWTQVQSGDFQEVEIHPTNSTIIYAVRKTGKRTEFFRSINSGSTFSLTGNGWPVPPSDGDQERTELAVSPANPNYVYAHCSGKANLGSGLYGVYVSTDQGSNWTFTCCGPHPAGIPSPSNPNLMGWSDDGTDDGGQYYYDMGFAVSPTNGDSIFLAGVNLWVSANGGASFICPAKWSHSYKPNYVHADIHDIQYYHQTKEIWIACDGGIFYSNDGGQNFHRRNVGISGTDFWGYGQGWWYGDVMLGGAYHNGTLLREENVYINDWLCTDGGDGTMGFVNPGIDRQVYSQYDIKTLKSNRNISPVTRTFANKPNNTYITGASNDLLIDPLYYTHWLTGSGTKLFKTRDNGYTFELLHDFGVDIAAMDHCWSNLNVIYVCTFPDWWGVKRIYRSDNGGYNFVEITPPSSILGSNPSLWIPYDIVVDHDDPMKVWIARTSMYDSNVNGFSIYHSSNGGNTWQNISGSGLNGHSPTSLFLQKGSPHGLYVGTRKAVFYKDDTLQDWVLYNQGLPAQTHSTRLEAYYRKQKIRNATDRSVWESPLYTPSVPIAYPSANTDKVFCHRDTVYFVDHSVVSDQNVTWQWSFPGGSPAASALRNPKVVYSQTGSYDVTLTVTDQYGASTKTIQNMIYFENRCNIDTIPGKSLSLNANTDYAVIPPYNVTTNTLTISCWIKPNGTQAPFTGIVFSGSGNACGLNLRNNNQLGYHWADASGSYNWNGGPVLPANEWSHVVLVIAPASATIYLNGVAYTRNATHAAVTFNADFRIGRDRNNESRNFIGQIDEVVIYNQALDAHTIRSLRHLTRKQEFNILGYYQFNEISGNAYNKVGAQHALLVAGASRLTSTAPVGGGVSHRVTINSGGIKDFQSADVKIYFPFSGIYPNGDVYFTKINQLPDQFPAGLMNARCYWLLNNYGSNATFTPPDSIQFYRSGNIAGGCRPMDYYLYRRLQNGEGSTWNNYIDDADYYYPYLPDNFVSFKTGNGVNMAGQYLLVLEGKENPDAVEICNGIDDNCNGIIDESYSLLVTNNADFGANTLRAILNCAQENDIITIDASIDTITLLSPLSLTRNMTIQDLSGNPVVLKANLNQNGFNGVEGAVVIGQNVNFSFSNIHFTQQNNTQEKPLMLNKGNLTMTNCRMSGQPDAILKHMHGAVFQAFGNISIE